jgi:hypothetical protein
MAQPYQLVALPPGMEPQSVLRVADNAHIPFDKANRDYAEYLEWLGKGNVPDPPELLSKGPSSPASQLA